MTRTQFWNDLEISGEVPYTNDALWDILVPIKLIPKQLIVRRINEYCQGELNLMRREDYLIFERWITILSEILGTNLIEDTHNNPPEFAVRSNYFVSFSAVWTVLYKHADDLGEAPGSFDEKFQEFISNYHGVSLDIDPGCNVIDSDALIAAIEKIDFADPVDKDLSLQAVKNQITHHPEHKYFRYRKGVIHEATEDNF